MNYFGHRGAAGLVAENTLESIQKALEYAVDGIEIDVHCCASGALVVIHDETLERTTNGIGEIASYTLEELQQYTTAEGFKIPTLIDVLEHIDARCVLNVELKGKNTALPVIKLLTQYIETTDWTYDHFVISSFDHQQLHAIQEQTAAFKLGVLTEETIDTVLDVAKALEAFAIHPPISSLTSAAVATAKALGYKVYVWTVNSAALMAEAEEWGVDAVITDYPNYS